MTAARAEPGAERPGRGESERAPFRKRLKRALRYPLVRLGLALAAALPFRFALSFGAWLGRVAYRLVGSQRRLALEHLAIAFPEKSLDERAAIARACFEELGRSGLEACQAAKIDVRSYVAWPEADIAEIRRGLAEGRGGLFVTGHVGNWELLARRIVAEGFDHAVVVRESGDPRLASLVERFRSAGGVRTVGRGSGSGPLREMLSAFKRGALLGLLIDQDTRVQGQRVPFFGRPAHTPRAAEDLALRTGAPVFVGFIHREAGQGHRLHTERLPVPPDCKESELTARLTARIEAEIRAQPRDWVWMHRRWKRGGDNMQAFENTTSIAS
ncbi:MAG TPA: lysophospholipid acyltransferase family protein [Myxococcales bacterium]|nr:lysophospholipid acyltransferase family protein [Myxococcales bacterium]